MGILNNSALKKIESSKTLLSAYHLYQDLTGNAGTGSVNHERKLVFVHNPKVAGTSFRDLLGLKGNVSHLTPGLLVNKKIWKKYFVIVAVREPLERFVSSYNYHTADRYDGFYLKKYPDMKLWSIEKYFEIFSREPFGIIPQVNYLRHPLSPKKPNFIVRYESLDRDVNRLAALLKLDGQVLPRLNDSKKKTDRNQLPADRKFRSKLIEFYREDYVELGYPLPNV
ncbi:MAG: sulfotransferase family 2 domain-containing protein [Prolixibacteraceae bacterium]